MNVRLLAQCGGVPRGQGPIRGDPTHSRRRVQCAQIGGLTKKAVAGLAEPQTLHYLAADTTSGFGWSIAVAQPALEVGLAALAFARRYTLGLLADLPAERMCHQPFPGANHVLWTLGHLAWSDDFFLNRVGGRSSGLPVGWEKSFGMGSQAVPEAAAYPAVTLVRNALNARREALLNWLRSLSDAQLGSPLPADLARFGPNVAALAATIAWHEGFHAGQIAAVRKSLGLAANFA
jgi:uncharacterized damage-inducible protein DinB